MSDRIPFLELASRRVIVLDGAMGSNLHQRTLDIQTDWMGHENVSEVLNFSRPDVIREIHESFLAVGCDGVETNTFGANKIVLSESGMADRVFENNKVAAEIARAACDQFETPERPRYVIGSIGPGTRLATLGMATWDELEDSYAEQIRGLLAGGADVLLVETQQDILVIKTILAAAETAFAEAGKRLPIMVQFSFDQNAGQNLLTGSDPSACIAAIEPFKQVQVLGVNCAFGPTELAEVVRYIAETFPRLVSALPNAGLPIMVDGAAHFPMTPPDFTRGVMRFVEEFGVNIVGGCCGTMPEHLRQLCDALDLGPNGTGRGRVAKRRSVSYAPAASSLFSACDLRQDNSYLIIAERTNTNGSRQFKRLLQEGDVDSLAGMAVDEVRDGSHMLDLCVDFVGRDGVQDMKDVVERFVGGVRAPLMLDSTNPEVMEAGLKLAAGRCVLNSMNLEDGPDRVAEICRLAVRYGAAVVAGCIDEDKQNAMARTADRKISIAKRLRDLAVNEHGLRDGDLMFDPLVLPISTGIEEDRRNALETIEGTRRISQELPDCHTVVGLSNVSFGLKPAARAVLNSVFLHELRDAGLTAAIVHASKILPRHKITDERWDAALELIYDRRREGFDPLTHFVGLFPDDGAEVGGPKASNGEGTALEQGIDLGEALRRHIIDGERRMLHEHLDDAMKSTPPLQIINTVLLEGMRVVGERFGSGQMQLPFVLQSAEVMKAAVAHLQPHMEKTADASKGSIVLATVRGDVHDIGKNLVDIILTNNGYKVHNLGIKQPVTEILAAQKKHNAHAIGMSGLLVKSVTVMAENLEELNAQGVSVPVLLGGAALTRDYAVNDLAGIYSGPLFYCKDAFAGLATMDAIAGGKTQLAYDAQQADARRRADLLAKAPKPAAAIHTASRSDTHWDNPVPLPPFWGRRIVKSIPATAIFPFINQNALFMGQWDMKKKGLSDAAYEKLLDETARPAFDRLKKQAIAEKLIAPAVAYGYFPVQADGDELIVYDVDAFKHADSTQSPPAAVNCSCGRVHAAKALVHPHGKTRERVRLKFPRQRGKRSLCISDFFRPTSSGQFDVLAVQMVTVGPAASDRAQDLFKSDQYQQYLYLHGFGVECAEALAEMWHRRIRQELGFGSEDASEMSRLFQQSYRGSRYSFGYPACPDLEQRTVLIDLLEPAEIGISLSETYMLVPEQSTDAIVSHHPSAKYFDV